MKLMKALSLKRITQQTLDQARNAFENDELDTAERLYKKIGEDPEHVFWSNFYLGRIAVKQDKLADARAFFETALENRTGFFWGHYELLSVLADMGSAHSDVLKVSKSLMQAPIPEAMQPSHWARLEAIGHRVFEDINRGKGAEIFAYIYACTKLEYLTELGLVRIVEECDDQALRKQIADILNQRPEMSSVARHVLSQYFIQIGEPSAVAPEADEENTEDENLLPEQFGDFLGAMKSAIARQDNAYVKFLRENAGKFPYRQQLFLSLVAEIELSHPKAAATHFLEHARLFLDAPKFPGIRLSYQLLDIGEIERAQVILSVLWTFHPEDTDVALAITSNLIRLGEFAEAKACFDAYLEPLSDSTDAISNVKSELLLANGDVQGALEVLQRYDDRETRPRNVLNSLVRIAAEQNDWDKVYELTAANLAKDEAFVGMLDPMVRAARKTGREREAYDLITTLDLNDLPKHRFMQQALLEDLIIAGEQDLLEQLETLDLPPARRARIDARMQVKDKPERSAGKNCIFFCADETYLQPAFTSLTSLIVSNLPMAQKTLICLIVENDLVEKAKAEAGVIEKAFKVKIKIIDASTLTPDQDKLRVNYGMPTGGHALAEAAYYRIFFALKLAQEGKIDKALYIDADTIVRPGVFQVFDIDLQAPMSARPEVKRPEISVAAKEHKLEHAYFNSGVLLFDFGHPDTEAGLEASVAAALDPGVKLFFHDQCALNIGFNGNTRPMDTKFNHFIAPEAAFSDSGHDAIILHYLDRPKPWDSLYRRFPDEWLTWWQIQRNLKS